MDVSRILDSGCLNYHNKCSSLKCTYVGILLSKAYVSFRQLALFPLSGDWLSLYWKVKKHIQESGKQ
jgi:hypothetical protein